MKRIIVIITLVAMIAAANLTFAYAQDNITEAPNVKIIIDEQVISCADVPIIINGRTMLPTRAIVSSLGVLNDDRHIIWDGKERSVTIYKDTTKIKLVEGSLTAYINDQPVELDAAPVLYSKNGRTYVPIRFIAQALNKAVVWEQDTRSVYIHGMMSQTYMWEEMHNMANSKVITLDEPSFSSKKIETSYVNELLAITEKADYNDKTKLTEILQRWRKGDFKQCVQDHNYLWEKQRNYTTKTMSQQEMWTEIHTMANTKIVSQDDRYIGRTPIYSVNIGELIAITENSNYDDKTILLDILYRWKNGDFRQCVEDHNYVWNRLGGEVGRAVRLMDDVQAAMSNYTAPVYQGDSLGRDAGKAVSLTEETRQAMEKYIEPKE